mgnify:CR=1 FL=1
MIAPYLIQHHSGYSENVGEILFIIMFREVEEEEQNEEGEYTPQKQREFSEKKMKRPV